MVAERQKGFSLLEVLVAFVILAVFLGALLPSLGTGLRAERRIEQRLQAVSLAEQRLASLGRDVPLRPGTRKGQSNGLRWSEHVVPFIDSAADPDKQDFQAQAYRVVIEVAWGSNPEAQVRLTSLRLAQPDGD